MVGDYDGVSRVLTYGRFFVTVRGLGSHTPPPPFGYLPRLQQGRKPHPWHAINQRTWWTEWIPAFAGMTWGAGLLGIIARLCKKQAGSHVCGLNSPIAQPPHAPHRPTRPA